MTECGGVQPGVAVGQTPPCPRSGPPRHSDPRFNGAMSAGPEHLEAAIDMASRAHRGQRYPSLESEPYICHPLRVMLAVTGFEAQTVAVLHDVLEDTPVTIDDLRALSLPPAVITAVEVLTHDPQDSYADYIKRAAAGQTTRIVKAADLADNLRNNRRLPTSAGVVDRIGRYEAALHRLAEEP